MTGCEDDPGFAVLDAHIRDQLVGAADTYASRTGLGARLKAILEAGTGNDRDDSAVEQG
jgi:hypothetical protein